MNNSINVKFLKPNDKNTDLLSAVEFQEKNYRNTIRENALEHDAETNTGYGKFANANNIWKTLSFIDSKLSIHKTHACAVFLSLAGDIKAIPILPQENSLYSEFVSGCSLNFMSIGVPKMPIRDLIKFKHDNQDKLRRLRLAITDLYNTYNNYQDVVEEISLSLNSYTKQVELLEKKYELEQMEFKFKLSDGLVKFLTTFNVSSFSNGIAMKKSMIQKQIDIENIDNLGISYLYEIGNLVNERSLAIKI